MKKRILILMSILIAISAAQASAGVVVSVDPVSQQAEVDDAVSVNLTISGLDLLDISAFDFDVAYDDSILAFVGYSFGNELGDIALLEAEDISSGDLGNGVIDLSEFSYLFDLSFQGDSITVATLNFTAAAEGVSGISVTVDELGDESGDPVVDYIVGNGTVNVVPEPATILLSLAGLGFIRRKSN